MSIPLDEPQCYSPSHAHGSRMANGICTGSATCAMGADGCHRKARKTKAFTLMESLVVVLVIVIPIGIATTSYRRVKWTTKVMNHAAENRGRLNQAVSDGKFRSQKKFDEEQERLRRQTDIGLTQRK